MSALDEYMLQYSDYSPINEKELSDEELEELESIEAEERYHLEKEEN